MIPDGERVVSDFLRSHVGVTALGARVVGKTPAATELPWVRVTRLDAIAEERSTPEWLINYLLQLDCYAGTDGGQPEANLLSRTVREALGDMPGTDLPLAVCSRTRCPGDARIPDEDFSPARDRVVLTAAVWLRPR